MTDFWFNHFNVTTRDGGGAQSHRFPMSAMRFAPMCWARFRTILGATAKHPAMLYYLDNAQSRMAPPSEREQAKPQPKQEVAMGEMGMDGGMDGDMGGEDGEGSREGPR